MEHTHNIYIVLSRTETGVARVLRSFGGLEYNHVSIALDREMKELYSFARSEQYGILTGRLVHETTDRYLVGARKGIPILVYELPVTEEEYDWVRGRIREIMEDPQYRYNLFSVLTYPIYGGFSTYKAYSCSEFAAYILGHLGYDLDRPLFEYRPDDLRPILEEYLCYEGSLQEYMPEYTTNEDYFRPLTAALVVSTMVAAAILLRRSVPWVRDIGRMY